jgi:putative nucleotidyltransferase with HDIG domain
VTAAPLDQPTLRDRLSRDLARGMSGLPALPRGVTEAIRLARMPEVDFDELARVASVDPPLAARVVSVANSASYARAGMAKVASVRQAAVRLGTQATRDVLFQVGYTSIFIDVPRFREHVEATFEHGAAVARNARLLAVERRLDPEAAFLAGLLHDLGRARCWKSLARRPEAIADVDGAIAVVDELHAAAGADLASAWRLPDEVVEVCLWHHEPAGRPYPLVVAAADAMVRLDDSDDAAATARGRLIEAGVPADRVDGLLGRATLPGRPEGCGREDEDPRP